MGLCRHNSPASALYDIADSPDSAGRKAEIKVQSNLRLLCGEHILLPYSSQCGNDNRRCARDRHSATVLQLRRVVAVGLHYVAVHLLEVGLQQDGVDNVIFVVLNADDAD